jgi:hypothetical protein
VGTVAKTPVPTENLSSRATALDMIF